jgi:hypothetical protein
VPRGQRGGSPRPYSRFSRSEHLLLPSSSSIVFTRLSGPRSGPTILRKCGSAGNSDHQTTERDFLANIGFHRTCCTSQPLGHVVIILLTSLSDKERKKLRKITDSGTGDPVRVDSKPSMHVRFSVLSAVTLHVVALWDVTLCSLVGGYKHFGGTCCLQLQY